MRFSLQAVDAEDRIRIATLNACFHPRKAACNPCLDAKWQWGDGSTTLYIIDRLAGPGWMGNELALCAGDDVYRIDTSWEDAAITGRYQVRARVYRRGEPLARLADDMRELAEAAIRVTCHYGTWMWLEGLPFAGADIRFDAVDA